MGYLTGFFCIFIASESFWLDSVTTVDAEDVTPFGSGLFDLGMIAVLGAIVSVTLQLSLQLMQQKTGSRRSRIADWRQTLRTTSVGVARYSRLRLRNSHR
jgi:hypothetical protein